MSESGAPAARPGQSDTSDAHPAAAGQPGQKTPVDRIVVSGATKSYGRPNARRAALGEVDLSIDRGRFVSIIGPSGCGKSTLLRLLAGLERPDSGSVSIFGATPVEATAAKMIAF